MKVHLINSPQKAGQDSSGFEFLYPPLGLLYLASYGKKKAGANVRFKFTDGLLLGMEKTLEEVKKYKPDIVGVSFTTSACEGAFDFINNIKKISKNILVVSGGPHTTAVPDEVLIRSETDISAIGEGEETFAEIITGKALKDIEGILYKNNGIIYKNLNRKPIKNLDDIPFPDRDLIEDWSVYKGYYLAKKKPDMVMISSRGCPYNCTFCSNPVWKVSKPFFRTRSPENIVEEIKELKDKYGAKEIFDETDDFNLSKNHAIKVCQAVIDAELDLSFKFQVRANKMDEELAENIRNMGTWLVFVGAESGNQRTLNGTRKMVKLEEIENCTRLLSEKGIKIYALFMGFNVWEEEGKLCYEGVEECRETIQFAKNLIKKKYIHFSGFSLTNPFPGSELFEIVKRHKLIDQTQGWMHWNDLWKLNMQLPGVTEKDCEIVKSEAGKLQALCTLKSGNINLKTAYPILRRGLRLVKTEIKKIF